MKFGEPKMNSFEKEGMGNEGNVEKMVGEKNTEKKESVDELMANIEKIWDRAKIVFTQIAFKIGTSESVPIIEESLKKAKFYRKSSYLFIDELGRFAGRYDFAMQMIFAEFHKKDKEADKDMMELLDKLVDYKSEIIDNITKMKKYYN